MSTDADNGVVRFTVKELLAAMNDKLDKALEKLDAKANAEEFDQLERRVSALERRFWTATGALLAIQAGLGVYLQLHH